MQLEIWVVIPTYIMMLSIMYYGGNCIKAHIIIYKQKVKKNIHLLRLLND